ncbi:hypothetical protein Tco_1298045 [Tanacetum coccineum]
MAEQNVPAQAPTRTDEQIVPRSQWLQIGKSNLLFDAQKIQKNPIFQISVDILRNTNFFRAFSASASVPAVYIQQFWNSMKYDEKTGVYLLSTQLTLLILLLSTQLTHLMPVLQMLWGIVTQTNVDHAELLWEEFTQGIQTFFSHKASHKASLKDPKKKAVPLLIPYGRFTKMIIYYLGSTSDVHKRPESPCHLPGDDFLLGNLKFYLESETSEVNTKKTPQDSASKQPEPATKHAPPKKLTTTTPVKPTKPTSSKQPKSPTKKPSKPQQESVPQGESDDPTLELAKNMSLDAHQEKEEGEGVDADIE